MSTFVVTQLTPEDWQEFRDLRLASLADSPSAFSATLAQQIDLMEADWRRRLEQRTQFVARSGTAALGTAGCFEENGGAELVSMWVHRSCRGQGVGDLLVQAVLAYARDRGHPQIRLWVTEGNRAAEALYARHGFVRTGESQLVNSADRQRREFAMRCVL
jgi:GNAT superfamily N-acetyltransferase